MFKLAIILFMFCLYAMLMSAAAPASLFLIASSMDGGPSYVFDTATTDFVIGLLSAFVAAFCFTRLNRLRKFWNRVALLQEPD